MAKTRQRLRAGSVLVAGVFVACGQANGGDGGEQGGSGGHAASVSSGGSVAPAGAMNRGGTPSATSGGATTPSGGSGTAAGGSSAVQTHTSGGRSPTGGAGGSTAGAMASGGKPAGGTSSGGSPAGGDSGGEVSAGAVGFGGTGGATECPAIKCTATCTENWLGLDGCPTCACAPPAAKLSARDLSCPSASLTMTAASSYYGGGINRWLIDFDWACSDSSVLLEPSRGHLQIGIIEPMSPPIDGKNRTFFYPRPAQSNLEYEVRIATVWLQGSGVPEIEQVLLPSSSFLSIRVEKGVLVGGVAFSGADSTNATTATMAGPFSVAVPTLN